MEVKTYNKTPKEVSEAFENFKKECNCCLKEANTCDYTDKLCTLNNCYAFKSRYLDFAPICKIPGRMNCTKGFNAESWKQGDCDICKISEKYENPE